MAKNNQKLINFHGSVKANLEAAKASLTAGEIAIVHNGQNDSLLATLDAKENGNLVYFITSGAVHNAITGVTGTLSQKLTERVDTLSGAVSAIIETYATSANTHNAIANAQKNASGYAVNAEKNAVSSAKGYTDGAITTLENKLQGEIDANESNITSLSGVVKNFSASVETNYATSANTHNAIAGAQKNASGYAVNAEKNAVSSAKTYVDAISGYIKSTYDTAIEGVKGQVTGLAKAVSGVSANILTYVDNKLVNVYTFKGSVESVDKLPTTGMVGGDVYNVVAADETNKIPAGTNYAWNSTDGKWDALGGSVDLSIYVTKESLAATTNDVETLKSDVAGLKTDVKTNADAIATEATTARAAEKANADAITAEATTARAAEKANAEAIETQKSRIDTLSALTDTINSAVQDVTVSTNSKLESATFTAVKGNDNKVALTLDLSTLVIDCGEF